MASPPERVKILKAYLGKNPKLIFFKVYPIANKQNAGLEKYHYTMYIILEIVDFLRFDQETVMDMKTNCPECFNKRVIFFGVEIQKIKDDMDSLAGYRVKTPRPKTPQSQKRRGQ